MKRLKVYQTVQPLGDTPFGENVNLYTGELSFQQTDIVVEGTGPTIVLARETTTAQTRDERQLPHAFHDWTLSVPRIETLMPLSATRPYAGDAPTIAAPGLAWKVQVTANDTTGTIARCSQFGLPVKKGVFTLDDWWHGYELITETGGRQQILKRTAENTLKPTMTGAGGQPLVFPAVTSQNWQITCLPTIANGGVEQGEAFLAISPDGTKYSFDYLVGERVNSMVKEMEPDGAFYLQRMLATMYVSKIEDRFGNTVDYHYTDDKLTSITASDGRAITIQWRTDARAIDTITVQPAATTPRVWHYEYASSTEYGITRTWLSAVVQPDSSRWSFNLNGFGDIAGSEWFSQCGARDSNGWSGGSYVSTLTHPSGLVGIFTTAAKAHARSYVPGACTQDSWDTPFYEAIPPLYGANSLIEKRFSGPGLNPQTWTYNYPGAQGSTTEDACAAAGTCASTAAVIVTDPDGNATRYTHSTRWGATEGKLLSTEYFQGASTLLRSETLSYANAGDGPYPSRLGDSMQGWRSNISKSETWTPSKQRQISQQGVTFTWQVNSFDQFTHPLSVTRSNTQGDSKTEGTEYYDHYGAWVIGQVARTTTNGIETSRTTYNTTTALPTATYAFNKPTPQQTLTYNANGTLATVSDGRDSANFDTTITLSGWKRGIPQLIQFPATPDQPAGVSKSAVVNDLGWIDSVTDENTYTTQYSYDLMGRLTKIDYPNGDNVDWTDTVVSFQPVSSAEYGIGAGHWKQTVSTGNGIKATYFDALWRPVVSEAYDAADAANTRSVNVTRYDAGGHAAFQSYPLRSLTDYATVVQGMRTTHDALGRTTRVEQDSELGVLATTTLYLSGFQTVTTNPRNQATTVTKYRTYDQPSLELPEAITHPEGAYTDIVRNMFDKPTSLTRRNSDSSLALTRRYVYDAYQQACKTIEPETGTTVMHYDAAGNLDWSAAGLALPSTTNCDTSDASIAARQVTRTYDQRNRVTTLAFPDGRGNQSWTYTADGLPAGITTNNSNGGTQVVNAYTYNKRRLLTGEALGQPGFTWSMGYGYNAQGNTAVSLTQPGGEVVNFAPNALGQATQATSEYGNYATGVSYYPNGAIAQFTYGNGIVHTLTQNTRQLPDRSQDAYGGTAVLDDSYDFDQNGNVAAISDALPGNRGNRTMTYDGLDRLKTTASPMFGTGASYEYDVLDNLTRVTTGGSAARDHYYCYDGSWRLTNVKTGSCSGASVIGLGYDEQGNLANKNGQIYAFDYGNRLRYASGQESYRYDGHGRRVSTFSPSPEQIEIRSIYGHDGVLRYQHDFRKGKVFNYIYLAGSLVATRETPMGTMDHALKYQHTDALGSPVAVTDANRNVVERSEYEPYGKLLNRPIDDGPGYTGHVEDALTGLTYMQQRYYDPQIGRFLSVDPVAANGNTGGNFNRYWYANNNPYRFVDPDGRQAHTRRDPMSLCDATHPCEAGSFGPSDPPAQAIFTPRIGPPTVRHGENVPIGGYLDDPVVKEALERAWDESNPNAPSVPRGQPGSRKREQGGWIVKLSSGQIIVMRVLPGTRDQMTFGTRPPGAELWFHTHPNTFGEGYSAVPSPNDLKFTRERARVPGIVITHEGIKWISYP